MFRTLEEHCALSEETEAVAFVHKGYEPTGKLFVASGGKNHYFPMTRRQMFLLQRDLSQALADMEPGKWRYANEQAA